MRSADRNRGDLSALLERAAQLEPWLLRRCWPPLTYMAIPSLLARADDTIRELAVRSEPAAKAALIRLAELRRAFKRDPACPDGVNPTRW